MLHRFIPNILSVISPQKIFIDFAKFLLFFHFIILMSSCYLIIYANITYQLRYWWINERSIDRRLLSFWSKIIRKSWSIKMHFLRNSIPLCIKQASIRKLVRIQISRSRHFLLRRLYRIARSLKNRRLRSIYLHLIDSRRINLSCLLSSLYLILLILSANTNFIINDRLKSISSFKQIIWGFTAK